MNKNVIKLKLHCSLLGHKCGDIIRLRTDDHGTIKSQFWRRRLKDAVQDKLVEVVKPSRGSTPTKSKSKLKSSPTAIDKEL